MSESSIASREACKICFHLNRVDFTVADELWLAVIASGFETSVISSSCFTRLRDEKGVVWHRSIEFFLVSLATRLEVWMGEKAVN